MNLRCPVAPILLPIQDFKVLESKEDDADIDCALQRR